jgi:hypothetical protein
VGHNVMWCKHRHFGQSGNKPGAENCSIFVYYQDYSVQLLFFLWVFFLLLKICFFLYAVTTDCFPTSAEHAADLAYHQISVVAATSFDPPFRPEFRDFLERNSVIDQPHVFTD